MLSGLWSCVCGELASFRNNQSGVDPGCRRLAGIPPSGPSCSALPGGWSTVVGREVGTGSGRPGAVEAGRGETAVRQADRRLLPWIASPNPRCPWAGRSWTGRGTPRGPGPHLFRDATAMPSHCPHCRSSADRRRRGRLPDLRGEPRAAAARDSGRAPRGGLDGLPGGVRAVSGPGRDRPGRDGGGLPRPPRGDRRGGRDQDGPGPEAGAAPPDPPRGPRPGPDRPPGAGPDHRDRPVRRAPLVRDGAAPGDDRSTTSSRPGRPRPDRARAGPGRRGRDDPGRLRPGRATGDGRPSSSGGRGSTATVGPGRRLARRPRPGRTRRRPRPGRRPTRRRVDVSAARRGRRPCPGRRRRRPPRGRPSRAAPRRSPRGSVGRS